MSRDPAAGVTKAPETYAPYAFANGNPFRFADPGGQFSLDEVAAAVAVEGTLATSGAAGALWALTIFGRPLTPSERETLSKIYGSSIVLDSVRVAKLDLGPFTLNNTIYAPAYAFNSAGDLDGYVFVHESAHIWQGQNAGWTNLYLDRGADFLAGNIEYDDWTFVLRDERDQSPDTELLSNPRAPLLPFATSVVGRFVAVNTEAQAEAITQCALNGEKYPAQCAQLMKFVREFSILYSP